ncbi:hypothetical protein [Streptomyces sp. NPDC059411]|uniref:hypothetical protein n=1 Tax=Streptomyces sp. NPDC059411 TaxID=3346825 RepID=UPI00369FE310
MTGVNPPDRDEMVILCALLAHMGYGDWPLIENGTSKAVYGMTAVPVKGEKPDAAATTVTASVLDGGPAARGVF